MNLPIEAQTLLRQAPATVAEYLIEGIKRIDDQLGEDYAADHPELLAAFITACTLDFAAGELHNLGAAVGEMTDKLDVLTADLAATVEAVAEAIEGVRKSI